VVDLRGKKGLVLGVANAQSIAWGCARAFSEQGAQLALTYLNAKAESYVRPLAESLQAPLILQCDVEAAGELEAVFQAIAEHWGRLDFVLHSIAFAPRQALCARVVDCPAEGFARAMDVSVHSLIRTARLAEPLMREGGTLLTLSYHGAHEVISQYGVMGPVKAALESVAQYLAAELGGCGIRVHTLSPGPIRTRAAGGIPAFEELISLSEKKSPLHRSLTIEDVGRLAAFLVSDDARALTGNTIYADAGYHIVD
jgi:enoyl-[acyl-carrier protein] reductase I